MTDQLFPVLRKGEFPVLDSEKHVYVDYTGAALPPRTLISAHANYLTHHALGNPHSKNPTSKLSTELVESTRARILSFFNCSPEKYSVIFTPNASGAIKLVAESFPFSSNSQLVLFADNHNSVHGIRQYAHRARAKVTYIPLDHDLRAPANTKEYFRYAHRKAYHLFAYPAQSNFSGVKHSLKHVHHARKNGYFVLLDAAAFVPSSPLNVSAVNPDYVAVSFYKIFGFPTGVGCLIVRKSAMKILKRPWFAGGTVQHVSVHNQTHVLENNEAAFEDGTLNFLSIIAVKRGLKFMQGIGMENVKAHVEHLTARLLSGLQGLQYDNGRSMIKIYGPTVVEKRGGCVAFDVLSELGSRIYATTVEKSANERNISLRTGCFCNPGAAEFALDVDFSRVGHCAQQAPQRDGERLIDTVSRCYGEYLGCIRVSLGLANNDEDVDAVLSFLREFSWEHRYES